MIFIYLLQKNKVAGNVEKRFEGCEVHDELSKDNSLEKSVRVEELVEGEKVNFELSEDILLDIQKYVRNYLSLYFLCFDFILHIKLCIIFHLYLLFRVLLWSELK